MRPPEDRRARYELLCQQWVQSLADEIEEVERSLEAKLKMVEDQPGSQPRRDLLRGTQRRLLQVCAFHDLVRRGLDPNNERRFQGRRSLIVRCAGRGHELGSIYPTAFSPVFVPTTRCLPLGPQGRDLDERWGHRQERREAWIKNAQRFGWSELDARHMARDYAKDERDPWIEEHWHPRAPDPDEVTYQIRGMAALHVIDTMWTHSISGREFVGLDLLCRCGTRQMSYQSLVEAHQRNDDTLTV